MSSLPANVHVSKHPCLQAKLSQLRSGSTKAKEVKSLVHDISLIVGCEALATAISTTSGPKVRMGNHITTNTTTTTSSSSPLSKGEICPFHYHYHSSSLYP